MNYSFWGVWLLVGLAGAVVIQEKKTEPYPLKVDFETTIDNPFFKGEPIPLFTTVDMEGTTVTSKDLIDPEVDTVLYFWADWCLFCHTNFVSLEDYNREKTVLRVIPVHRSETETLGAAANLLSELKRPFYGIQDDGSLYTAANGMGMPLAVWIHDGRVDNITRGLASFDEELANYQKSQGDTL